MIRALAFSALLLAVAASSAAASVSLVDLRNRLEALLAWDIGDDDLPHEVARTLALDALFAADRSAAEEVLVGLLEATDDREELREAGSYVAAMNYFFRGGASGDPAVVRPLRKLALAEPAHEYRYSLLAHEISACIDDGSWEAGLKWNAEARACLDEADPVQRLERETYLDSTKGMILSRLARFQEAAASVEAAREKLERFQVALENDSLDARRFVYTGPALWEHVGMTRLALPLAQTRFERVADVYAEILREPRFADIDDRAEARLELRLALAEVEGQRRGLFPDAEPVARLDGLVDRLGGEPIDTFRARYWAARSLADVGDFEAASDRLARARDVLESRSGMARYEPLATALESCLARRKGEAEMRAVLPRLEDAYARFLAEWRATPLDEAGTGYAAFEEWILIRSELITLRDTLAPGGPGAERALRDVVAAQALGSLSRRLGGTEVDLDRIRGDLLGPDEGALVYAFGRDRLHLFLVDRDEVAHVPLAADFELDAARGALLDVVRKAVRGDVGVDAVEAPAATYAGVVLPPAAIDRLENWGGVVVVGLEAIGFAPFELLRPGGGGFGGARLGEARALRYLPSFPVAAELLDRDGSRPPAARELSLFAAPGCGVPAGEAERYVLHGEAIAALTAPFESSRSWVGPGEATAAALRSEGVGDAVVTHFVVHGERDLYRPRPGGLRLWGDGGPAPVWAAELEELPASPLVVLTSCEAGRAPLRRGDDGVGHLGAALFLGGASTVLLSHTDIGLAPSVAALAKFLDNLRGGAGAAEAMRAARAELVDPVQRFHAGLVHVTGLTASRFEARASATRPGASSASSKSTESVSGGSDSKAPTREFPNRGRFWILGGLGLAVAVAAWALAVGRRART